MSKEERMLLIGLAMKEARNKMKKTQIDIAKETGLSRTYLSDLENGRYMPSMESLFKIASVLNLDLNSLI